jgi:hypothetical protein
MTNQDGFKGFSIGSVAWIANTNEKTLMNPNNNWNHRMSTKNVGYNAERISASSGEVSITNIKKW